MAFRRRGYKKRSGGGSRWKTYKAAGKQLWRDVKKLKSMVNVEYKNYETTLGGNVSTSGFSGALFTPVRGNDFNQINGREVKIVSIQGYVTAQINASAIATRVRWAIVGKKRGGQSVILADVYDDAVGGFRNLDNRKDIFHLHQGTFTLSNDGGNGEEMQRNFYKKMNMHVIFNSTNGGTYADCDANAMWFVCWTDEATATPGVQVKVRIRYVDN